MKRAGVRDGLLLLDEVDKMGRDARGDPAAALLEARQASLHAFVWLLPRNQHDAAPAAPPPRSPGGLLVFRMCTLFCNAMLTSCCPSLDTCCLPLL